MFLAMNRFKIVKGKEDKFEQIWKERDTHLKGVKGFFKFNLMKGSSEEDFLFTHLTVFGKVKKNLLIGPNQTLLN